MSRDLENATKAAQCAALLVADLKDLVRSDNLLLSDAALADLAIVAAVHIRLQRLQDNLETMEAKS